MGLSNIAVNCAHFIHTSNRGTNSPDCYFYKVNQPKLIAFKLGLWVMAAWFLSWVFGVRVLVDRVRACCVGPSGFFGVGALYISIEK